MAIIPFCFERHDHKDDFRKTTMNDSGTEHIAENLGSNLRLPLSTQGLADFFRAHINSVSHPGTQPLQTTNLLQLQPQLQEQDNEAVDQQAMLDLGLQLAQENNYESTTKVEEAPKSKRRGGGGAKKTKRENTASPGAISSEKISPFPIQDDYKWRKYGQKTLKGSEFPRDYFKCSVPQCNAKKQVEKCIENGEEKLRYIYFGEHSHPPPKSSHLYAKDQQSFKTAVIAAFDPFVAEADKLNSEFLEELEEEAVDGVQQIDANNMIGGVELTDGQVAQTDPTHQEQEHQQEQQNYEVLDNNKLLMTTSTEDQVLSMLKDDGTQQSQQNGEMIDPNLMAEYAQVENGAIQGDHVMDGTGAINYEDYMQSEQQPPTKKRKVTRKKSANSQIRRLIVECTKDIDYMEDGYHWRKYGQKTLKGNPFPRSYYKCIEPNCSVRKQVEQTLGGSIINIYEGYHNHPGNPQAVPNEAHKRKHHEMAQAEMDNTLFNTLLSELNDGQSSPKRLKTGEENVPNGLLNASMLLTTSGSVPITFDMANLQYLFTHTSVPNILKSTTDSADNSNNTNNTNVQLVEATNTLNNNNANDNGSSENDHLLNTSAEQLNDVNLPNVDGSIDEQSPM